MYVAACVEIVLFVILYLASRGEKVPETGMTILRPFYRMAAYCYRNFPPLRKLSEKGRVGKDLEKLYPVSEPGDCLREYYVTKTGLVLAVLLAGGVFGAVAEYQARENRNLLGQSIRRGDYRQEEKNVELEASMDGRLLGRFQVTVKGRKPQYQEADDLEKEFWERVCVKVQGRNLSLKEVNQDMELPETLEGYPFDIEWESCRPDIIDNYGLIQTLEEGEEEAVILTAAVTYEEWEWQHSLEVTVIPPYLSKEERMRRGLEAVLEETERTGREEETYSLPEQWMGEQIVWSENQQDYSLVIWLLSSSAAVCIFFLMDKDLHGKLEERNQRMKEDYPLIVNKLVLYLGAGMTVRGAFCKIAEDGAREKSGKRRNHPAYDEMLYACREMKAGLSESGAYEHFGRRTGLQEYIRMTALLSQNLRKGNSTLLERLREESARSMQEQMNNYRRAGEESSTKLLVPMIMMLGIVMVMIMIPAFGSFGM